MKRLIVITNVLLMQVIMLAGPVVLTKYNGTTSAGIRPNDNIPITNVDYTNNLLTIESNTELHNVYIELSDVKNILVLQNWLERIRKEVTNKVLSIKRISEFLNFPILAQPTLKKI